MSAPNSKASRHNFSLPSKIFRAESSANLQTVGKNPSGKPDTIMEEEEITALPRVGEPSGSSRKGKGASKPVLQDEPAKTQKPSVWRRFLKAIKKPFRKQKEPEMVIGGPTDFKHVSTGLPTANALLEIQRRERERFQALQKAKRESEGDWETVRGSTSFTL